MTSAFWKISSKMMNALSLVDITQGCARSMDSHCSQTICLSYTDRYATSTSWHYNDCYDESTEVIWKNWTGLHTLYRVAVKSNGLFPNLYLPLGGMHMLMSFVGALDHWSWLASLLPTTEAFSENMKRAHLQACIWKNALELNPPTLAALSCRILWFC